MASTKTGERVSGPPSEVIGAEELRNTQPEASGLLLLTKKEVDGSTSSVDGDQGLSGHTQSLSAEKSRNETGEHEENGVSSGNDVEDAPSSLENSKDPSPGYETSDIRTSATDEVDQYISELPPGTLDRVSQGRMWEQHESDSTMHAARLQAQRNLQLRVADAINQVGAASNEFSEVPDTRWPSGHPEGCSNHALRDYQMQLMELEQKNKMRLMMARQEQDQNSTAPAASAPQELPDATGGNDSAASHGFKAHL
ncbi:hypothetical protein KVR01_004671 [Diaporthe batatas]|uniref:uncharacterized protein n=1 Tax=Diaporthe batatas TaxID=748121 RepID=UPI001D03EA3C|nr:uncharacterized protein KVR01_004671 [Diaporthe batatas]KAG8166119.1 hypothetical protein KVR01_004671 [Diaporthe batatas]